MQTNGAPIRRRARPRLLQWRAKVPIDWHVDQLIDDGASFGIGYDERPCVVISVNEDVAVLEESCVFVNGQRLRVAHWGLPSSGCRRLMASARVAGIHCPLAEEGIGAGSWREA